MKHQKNNKYTQNITRMKATVSFKKFEKKPPKEEMGKIKYQRRNVSLDELVECIRNQYILSANFTEDNANIITQKQRCYSNFIDTHIVMIDLDNDVECSLDELMSRLKYTPTIAYTTYSHQQEGKGNRYRLLYLFRIAISDINVYKSIYQILIDNLGFKLNDNCGGNVTQAIFGANESCQIIQTENIYSISDFDIDIPTGNGHSNYIRKEERNIIGLESPIQNQEYINDFWNMAYSDLLLKYSDTYPIFVHTPLEDVDDNTPFIMLPSDYIEIKRYWCTETVYDENGNKRYNVSRARKIRDGERRRKKLFLNGILRRIMVNDLSFEHLLNNMIYELYHYIDNSKDRITKKDLFVISVNIYKSDIDNYNGLIKRYKRKFIVNDKYCIKHNLNRKQVRNISRKLITYNQIGELYDFNLTDKQNVEAFKEYGLNISTKTLQRFRKEMGITKYNKSGNGHSNYINIEEENIIKLESPIQLEVYNSAYYDYKCELIMDELEEYLNDGFYDIDDASSIKGMCKYFIKRVKDETDCLYTNDRLIELFKERFEYLLKAS